MKNLFFVFLICAQAGCASYVSFDPPASFGPRDSFMRVSS